MKTRMNSFADSAKGFTKSPLGIIALFIVLIYGFASLVVSFGKNIESNVKALIYFMVLFPLIVFIGFLWLVAKHHKKLYGPSDFRDEENFLKMQKTAMSLAAASAMQPENEPNSELSQKYLEKILELVSHTSNRKETISPKNRILWVDDKPENNIYERKAFEAQGIEFSLAQNTNEALNLLDINDYAAIISDMGRKEGAQEGFKLLEKVKNSDNNVPFFIYTGSNPLEYRKTAKELGAKGITHRPEELYKMVMASME